MAKAPRPGVGTRKEAAEKTRKITTITLRGESLSLAAHNLPMGEKVAVRLALGRPWETFLNPVGEDTFAVLWWLARRANGEPGLSWAVSSAEWPDDLDLDVDIVAEVDDPEIKDDDPEA